jgi:hypothetical protein
MSYVWNTGLSKQEIQMFYETINTCVTTIDPLASKYTWSQSDNVNKYLPKCYQQLESVKSCLSKVYWGRFKYIYISYRSINNNVQVQKIENCYKQCNTEIIGICTQISNTPLFGNELELIKINGLNHKKKNVRFWFQIFIFLNTFYLIHKLKTIFISIVIEFRSWKLSAIIMKLLDTWLLYMKYLKKTLSVYVKLL